MRISDWSSDCCSSDLDVAVVAIVISCVHSSFRSWWHGGGVQRKLELRETFIALAFGRYMCGSDTRFHRGWRVRKLNFCAAEFTQRCYRYVLRRDNIVTERSRSVTAFSLSQLRVYRAWKGYIQHERPIRDISNPFATQQLKRHTLETG